MGPYIPALKTLLLIRRSHRHFWCSQPFKFLNQRFILFFHIYFTPLLETMNRYSFFIVSEVLIDTSSDFINNAFFFFRSI